MFKNQNTKQVVSDVLLIYKSKAPRLTMGYGTMAVNKRGVYVVHITHDRKE